MKPWPLVALVWLLCTAAASAAGPAACPSVGVIRWDAWFGAKGVPGVAVEKTLGPSRWHDRLPVCAQIVAPDSVRISCDSPDQMVLEIDQAADAGIGYFAFIAYPEADPMTLGLQAYLKAPNRRRIRFALISEMDKWGGTALYRGVVERYVRLMREPGYQTTPQGRPLFYLGFVGEEAMTKRFGGRKGYRAAIDDFRAMAQAAGLPNPYIVLMEPRVPRAPQLMTDLGLDALTAYAVFDNDRHTGEYAQLTDLVTKFWRDAQASRLDLVPPVMSGWDRRPRVLNPLTWERSIYSDEQMLRFFKRPSMPELRDHVASALQFAQAYSGSAATRSVLIYAWNEFDEGGWLAPTRGDAGGRLRAVKEALDSACPTGRAQ